MRKYMDALKEHRTTKPDEPVLDKRETIHFLDNIQENLIERTLVFRLIWINRHFFKPYRPHLTSHNDLVIRGYAQEVLLIRETLKKLRCKHAIDTTEYIYYTATKILSSPPALPSFLTKDA